jgi:phosphoglycerate kinase
MAEQQKRKLTIEDLALEDTRLFVRVDFNVPLNQQCEVTDDSRIRAALPTIRYAREHGAKVLLAAHLGRPGGKPDPRYSLRPVAARLRALLDTDVGMAQDCIGDAVAQRVNTLHAGDVLLLENLRFHPGERNNEADFAQALASLADLYVNDAFGACHRAHASIVGVPERLGQAAAGYLLQREVEQLGSLLAEPAKPFTVILGGAKVSDKLGVIEHLLPRVDAVLIGGGMAYTFLQAQGINVENSLVETEHLETARRILKDAEQRGVTLLLPRDHVVAAKLESGVEHRTVSQGEIPAGWMSLDIGPATIEAFAAEIRRSQTIFWNGPMGVFETEPFDQGTRAIGRAVADANAFSVAGGGDTVAAIHQTGIAERINHISTGGGAALAFLEGKELPGIAVLTDKQA